MFYQGYKTLFWGGLQLTYRHTLGGNHPNLPEGSKPAVVAFLQDGDAHKTTAPS